jgi:tetratricopeptide (TPR) repeat protein
MSSRPRIRFDRYLPLRSLRGGMGVVELCADMAGKQPVALKTFLPELLADARAREQFLQEASVWVQIGSHPHVVTAHIVRRDGEQVYVVCEYVAPPDGIATPSLRGWLGRPLAAEQALDLALGIARGMRWATERVPGLVHRDLKPENVLVGRDRRAKVSDFGLALLRGQKASGLAGTPAYMAPEQWSGAADVRADVYAWGLILLEMLSGSTGIAGRSMAELAASHRAGHAFQLAASSGLPPSLQPIVASAVYVDPARRFASWDALEQALLTAWPHVSRSAPPVLPAPAEASRQARILETWSHAALADALVDLGQLADATQGYRMVLDRARDLAEPSLTAAGLGNLGQVLLASGDLNGASEALEASLAIKRQLGDRLGEGNTLSNRGNLRVRQDRVPEALDDFARAASLFIELGQERRAATARFNMVPALARLGRVDEAKAIGAECREVFKKLGDLRGQGAVLGTLGQIQRRAGDLAGALECSNRALECFRQVADKLAEGRELSFLGHTLRALGRMPEALDAFQRSMELGEECGDALLVGSACHALAEMTPPLPQFVTIGRLHAERAAAAYRRAGREDLARDSEEIGKRFGR